MASKTETRRLKAHENLLISVIKRQAGTLHKAILEAVMNAVDAKAKNIHIELTSGRLTIKDDGIGITEKQDIFDFWETFGQPPREHEKKTYGQFRMGRGQLFAFGKNTWVTGPFKMYIDVEQSLDYTLEESRRPTKGCTIDIELYEEVLPSLKAQIERELGNSIKYAPAAIYFNNEPLSIDPSTVDWDIETDEAYIRLKDSGSLYVFNLGVLVCIHPDYTFGVGGEIVSKQQLKVNFARNEVMASCLVWKKIKPLVDQRAAHQVSKQPALTDAARRRLAEQIRANELPKHEARKAKVLTDINGRNYSLDQLQTALFKYKGNLTVAPSGHVQGAGLFAHKLAFVLSTSTLERFGAGTLKKLVAMLDQCTEYDGGQLSRSCTLRELTDLTATLDEHHELIDAAEWRVEEQVVIGVLNSGIYGLARGALTEWANVPRFVIGRSETVRSWTDGATYIAINRSLVAEIGTGLGAWIAYGHLLCHMLLMRQSGTDVQPQSPEFFTRCLELAEESIPGFVENCLTTFPRQVESLKRKLTKTQLKTVDQVEKHTRANRDLLELTTPSDN